MITRTCTNTRKTSIYMFTDSVSLLYERCTLPPSGGASSFSIYARAHNNNFCQSSKLSTCSQHSLELDERALGLQRGYRSRPRTASCPPEQRSSGSERSRRRRPSASAGATADREEKTSSKASLRGLGATTIEAPTNPGGRWPKTGAGPSRGSLHVRLAPSSSPGPHRYPQRRASYPFTGRPVAGGKQPPSSDASLSVVCVAVADANNVSDASYAAVCGVVKDESLRFDFSSSATQILFLFEPSAVEVASE